MDETVGFNRRRAIALASLVGVQAVQPSCGSLVKGADGDASEGTSGGPLATDRDRVVAAGFTEAEADCWELAGRLAGCLLDLPDLHPMEDHEVAHAIHVIQNRLLARVTYRKYRELTRRAAGDQG